jgi:CheY-like chemotaxis protein
VDDNLDSAESLSLLLEFLGAEVQTANDGSAALEAIRSYRPSVVLLDIGLPGMDGYEVARLARELPEGRSATLIALTGWGQEDDRRRSKEAGIDHLRWTRSFGPKAGRRKLEPARFSKVVKEHIVVIVVNRNLVWVIESEHELTGRV